MRTSKLMSFDDEHAPEEWNRGSEVVIVCSASVFCKCVLQNLPKNSYLGSSRGTPDIPAACQKTTPHTSNPIRHTSPPVKTPARATLMQETCPSLEPAAEVTTQNRPPLHLRYPLNY
jgi:hypothetical protein